MAAVTWKCPNCGGGLTFDPDSQKFECEYCLSQFGKEELERIAPDEGEEQRDTAVGPEDGAGEGEASGLPRYCTCVPAAGRRL